MKAKDLDLIWQNAYLVAGSENMGEIVSNENGETLGEYEIENDVLDVTIYKDFYDYEFDDSVINEVIEKSLVDIGLDIKTKIKWTVTK